MSGSVLSIDLGAVAQNYKILRDKASGAKAGAAVKANGYGLGMIPVAQTLAKAGCADFFVATIDEAVQLRPAVEGNIFILNGIRAGDNKQFKNIIPVLNSLEDIKTWTDGPCALHFDTGMNRLGLSADETRQIIAQPSLIAHLDVRLAMSHFSSAEDASSTLNKTQCERFAYLKKHLPFTRWSLANSSGIFHAPHDLYDLVRPGYALYGGNPTPEAANPMKSAVRLDARVLQTRHPKKGETVGYNGTHRFEADSETATIGLGYADGFFRLFSNNATVYFDGQPCPVLGRVSMDLVSIGTGHLARKPKPGDMVEILGPHQSIDQLAASGGTIGYEVLTALGGRHMRRYIDAS